MKLFFVSFFIFSLGVLCFLIFNSDFSSSEINGAELIIEENATKELSYMEIFLNNLMLGFLLSIIGYFSGGILTILLLFWNGYLITSTFYVATSILSLKEILYFSKHIPTELIALFIFSSFGLRGFLFYRKIIFNKENEYLLHKKDIIYYLIIPSILLLISSVIEVL